MSDEEANNGTTTASNSGKHYCNNRKCENCYPYKNDRRFLCIIGIHDYYRIAAPFTSRYACRFCDKIQRFI